MCVCICVYKNINVYINIYSVKYQKLELFPLFL